jgi:hypothetical protein
VGFRFEALKDVLYDWYLDARSPAPELTPLLENFRTHAAISRLAHRGVLEPLLGFFPSCMDRLAPETSALQGVVWGALTGGGGRGRRSCAGCGGRRAGAAKSEHLCCGAYCAGPRPLFLLPSCGRVEQLLAGCGGGGSGSSAVVVLVPNEAVKRDVATRLRSAEVEVPVLTALESKGLEFKARSGCGPRCCGAVRHTRIRRIPRPHAPLLAGVLLRRAPVPAPYPRHWPSSLPPRCRWCSWSTSGAARACAKARAAWRTATWPPRACCPTRPCRLAGATPAPTSAPRCGLDLGLGFVREGRP